MDPESTEALPEPIEAPAEVPSVEPLDPPPEPPAPAEASVQELAELPPPEAPEALPEITAGPYEVKAQFVEPMVPDNVTVEFAELPPREGQTPAPQLEVRTLDTRVEDNAMQGQLELAEEVAARQRAADAVSDAMEEHGKDLVREVGTADQPSTAHTPEQAPDPIAAAGLGIAMAAALALKKK